MRILLTFRVCLLMNFVVNISLLFALLNLQAGLLDYK